VCPLPVPIPGREAGGNEKEPYLSWASDVCILCNENIHSTERETVTICSVTIPVVTGLRLVPSHSRQPQARVLGYELRFRAAATFSPCWTTG
jgi:hypothetical protein